MADFPLRKGYGADSRIVRQINQRGVFSAIKKYQTISVSEISRRTGLSIATVKSVLTDLMQYELVRETGEGFSTGGRKPKLYSLNMEDIFISGMELHSHSLKIGILKLSGEILFSNVWALQSMPPENLAKYIQTKLLETLNDLNISKERILGVGICQPGIVDLEGKKIKYDVHLGWTEVDLGPMLQDLIPAAVFLSRNQMPK
jgi:N-acetylglucosamine repressor